MLLRDRIYQGIRGAILRCEFLPGQELREQALAAQYRASRSPVRDSLLRLEQENLVEVLPRRGYRVKPVSAVEVEDVFGMWLLLEPRCAEAAAHADGAALQALDRFRGFPDKVDMHGDYMECDKSFHRAIIDLSGNRLLRTIVGELIAQFNRFERASVTAATPEVIRRTWAEHEAIIVALQARDSRRAYHLAYNHIDSERQRFIPRSKPLQERQDCCSGVGNEAIVI